MKFTSRKSLLELFLKHKSVSTDTRKIKNGSIFFALKGTNFNGNQFAKEALKAGAAISIVDEVDKIEGDHIYLVEDVLLALQNLAHDYRQTFDIPFIGITGTNGKTTTKELLHAVLNEKYHCYATKGNFNNHIGVPLTLLELTDKHEIAIIEMGANKLKDIEELCQIANPTHGIITNVGKAHLEGFGSFEGVKKTKGELYDYMNQKDGPIFINADNEHLQEMALDVKQRISYSTHSKAELNGELTDNGLFLNFRWSNKEFQSEVVKTQLSGAYNLENMMAAVAIGTYFSVPTDQISHAISNYAPSNNRSQIEHTETNTLILDAYNANLTSTKAALENLSGLNHDKKWFVLGDMLELGDESKNAHQEIIELSKANNLNGFFVGAEYAAAGASPVFMSNQELITELQKNPIKNQLILIKGSRGIKLESIVEFL